MQIFNRCCHLSPPFRTAAFAVAEVTLVAVAILGLVGLIYSSVIHGGNHTFSWLGGQVGSSITFAVSGFSAIILPIVYRKIMTAPAGIPKKIISGSSLPSPKDSTIEVQTIDPISQPKQEKKTESDVVLASEGQNQYSGNNPSACTWFACKFIAETPKEITSESISNILSQCDYKSDKHLDTDKVIEMFSNLELLPNPLFEQQYTPELQVDRTTVLLETAVAAILDEGVHGVVVTANASSIALVKRGKEYVVFDTHGDQAVNSHLSGTTQIAYAKKLRDSDEVVTYLEHKFPFLKGDGIFEGADEGILGAAFNLILFWPLKIKK